MIEIERFVFVCPNLEEAFSNKNWEKFCLSPIRQTRPFVKSRYVLFKNVMLEILEVADHDDAKNFVFFEECKNAFQPIWVATGCKVENLELALFESRKQGIFSLEDIISRDLQYEKGFKHSSSLLSKKWAGKNLYLTEYDENFYSWRQSEICSNPLKQKAYSALTPSLIFEDLGKEKQFNLEYNGCFNLVIFAESSHKNFSSYDFGWIVLHEGI